MSTPMLPAVLLVTDGSCVGNPGPGGWAALLRFGARERVLTGADPATTNNRMELTAVWQGLAALHRPCAVTLKSDSQLVVRAFADGWLTRWQANGWRGSNGRPVLNQDLWAAILAAAAPHTLTAQWVRGHATDPDNLRVDALAQEAARTGRTGRTGRSPSPASPAP